MRALARGVAVGLPVVVPDHLDMRSKVELVWSPPPGHGWALAAGANVALEPVALAWGPSGMLSSPPPAHPCAGDAPGDGR